MQERVLSRLRLRIGPVIQNAEDVRKRVERELPNHTGLLSLAAGVGTSARDAERVAQRLRKPFGLHRLPAAFLALALLLLIGWIYIQFFRTTILRIALPDRDFKALKSRMQGDQRLQFTEDIVPGSPQAVIQVSNKKADLGVVQGGIEIPANLPRLETPDPEVVLWFLRPSISNLGQVKRILTSVEGAGSHTVAQQFLKAWKVKSKIDFVHEWNRLSSEKKDYVVSDDIDAVFVVKDLADDQTMVASERLADAGFRLASPDLSAPIVKTRIPESESHPRRVPS